MRQIVLSKFKRFHSTLTEKHKELLVKVKEITNLNFNTFRLINLSQEIDESSIRQHQQLINEINSIFADIDMYMMDLQIGLQNEFYKRIFRKGVPKRNPADPSIEVLEPEKTDISLL